MWISSLTFAVSASGSPLVGLSFRPSSSSRYSSLHPRGLGFAPSWPVFVPSLSCTPSWPHLLAPSMASSSCVPRGPIFTHTPHGPVFALPPWPLLARPSSLAPRGPVFVLPSWPRLRLPLVAPPLRHARGSSVPRDKLTTPKPVSAPCSSSYYVFDQSPQSRPHGDDPLLAPAVSPLTTTLQSTLHDVLDLCHLLDFVTKLDPPVRVRYGHSQDADLSRQGRHYISFYHVVLALENQCD